MKFSIAAIVPVAMALSAHAAAAGLSCKPFGKPNTLIGHNNGNSHKQFQYGFKEDDKFHGFTQVKNSTADQEFQFYECEAPGDKFSSSNGKVHFGQIRPVDKDDLCLSNTGVFIYKDGVKDDDHIRLEPQGIENRLLLKPCASKGNDLRHQWFSARNVDGCGLRVALRGEKDDIESDGLVHNGDWSVSFNPFDSWPWREATYLARDVDSKCPMQRN